MSVTTVQLSVHYYIISFASILQECQSNILNSSQVFLFMMCFLFALPASGFPCLDMDGQGVPKNRAIPPKINACIHGLLFFEQTGPDKPKYYYTKSVHKQNV